MSPQVIVLICLAVIGVLLLISVILFSTGIGKNIQNAAASVANELARVATGFVHFGYVAGRGVVLFAQSAEQLFVSVFLQITAGLVQLPGLVRDTFNQALVKIRMLLQESISQLFSLTKLITSTMQSAAVGLRSNFIEVGDRSVRQIAASFNGFFPALIRTAIQASIGIYSTIVDAGLLVFSQLQILGTTIFDGLLTGLNAAVDTSVQAYNIVFGPIRSALVSMCDVVGCSVP